ncbi:Gfo/Idh/MocA family oxidoreductase [Candidatus Izimaplasma bacterium]|nr:Gfo/Idh/MocA family oxidoreductase [Candidatus Izimaplasma bacterium]
MIRFGIVGAGAIAQKFAIDIMKAEHAVVTAIASRTFKKADEFKNRFHLEYAFGNYKEMAESDVIDAVYIATPHNFHMEQAILFLNQGKHVLVEKPISVNIHELEEMIKSAKKNNRLLMEAMWTRYLPVTKFVKEIVDSKQYGEIKEMNFEFGFDLISNYDEKRRLLNPQLAGGSLLDLGVYPISSALHYTESKVFGIEATALIHTTGVDTDCNMTVTFENGVKAFLKSSMSKSNSRQGVITFENHEIVIPNFWSGEECVVDGVKHKFPHKAGGFEYQVDAFAKTIQQGLIENDIMSFEESRNTMKIMDEVRDIIGLKYPFE